MRYWLREIKKKEKFSDSKIINISIYRNIYLIILLYNGPYIFIQTRCFGS